MLRINTTTRLEEQELTNSDENGPAGDHFGTLVSVSGEVLFRV